ncbi:MFS transporter [Roseiarcaceae bacterium H3SJ34-1]|uniref:MFS transporter n=1 Tax=Terripilifer ovatus TaxID=3032367 RepID=UPI003AB9687C|nr:MFS transporter [Roseiarcaceae bacterium H3SJ34-1]
MNEVDTRLTNGAVPVSGGAAVSWQAVWSTYLPALILALGTGIALPAIPTLAKSFDVSFGVASGVVTAFLIGNLAATIPSGWLIDRFGRRSVMIGGPLLTAVTALLVVFSHTFPQLIVLRFFNGFAAQMWVMGRLASISQDATTAQRGRLVSWMFGMDNTGKLAGPVLGGFIASEWGTSAPFVAYAVLALLALLTASLGARNGVRKSTTGKEAPAPRVRRTMSLREIILPRLVYFGVTFFAGLTRGPVQADLLHLYAAFEYHLGPAQIGYLATGAALLSWPIGFIAGWMMDRFGRKRTMVPGFVGVAFSMTALAVSAFAQLSLHWYVVLFFIGVGLQALTGGSVQTVGADVAPPQARGTFLGLWRFTGQGGASLSPIIFALLADQVNYGSSFLFTAGAAAAVAFLLIRHVPETRDAG